MLNINIISVGKVKEAYFKLAIEEYSKRLSKYCSLNIIELQDEKLPTKHSKKLLDNVKNKECQKILPYIKKDSYTICLDLSGTHLSSEQLSQKIQDIALNYCSTITFIIGGTLGLTQEILNLSDYKLSFSKMTFPHQMIKVFLLEQLFRSFKISNNETYHW